MKVTIEVTDIKVNDVQIANVRLVNEMSHEEFTSMLEYYASVFASLITNNQE